MNILSREDLNTYKYWNYSERGNFGFWHTDSLGNDKGYICTFNERNDSLIIEVHNPQQFIKDFSLDIPKDNTLRKLTLIKSLDTYFLVGEDSLEGRRIYFTKLPNDYPFFKTQNPFEFIRSIDHQKDSLQISGISCDNKIGNFIQFYLPGPYILTYLPDSLYLNPFSKDIWLKDFDRGEKLSKNWNLRESS